jgi:hypothetical protein
MELIAAILLAGPLGFLGGTRKRGLVLYLLVWTVIFPVQTIDVYSTSSHGDILYWVVNAVILTAGVALNALGIRLRERRIRTTGSAASA